MAVRVGPFQRIVNVHWPVDPTAIEYIVMDTRFYEPDTSTHDVAFVDPGGNPGGIVGPEIPDQHVGFDTIRTGGWSFVRSNLYTRDLENIAIYNSLGEPPPGVFFDYAKFSGALTPGYPINFSADGLVYRGLPGIARPYSADAFGRVSFEAVDSGATLTLPGSAGSTYSGFFHSSPSQFTQYGVLPDGDADFYTNEFGDTPGWKTLPVPYNPDNGIDQTFPEVISTATLGVTATYAGHPYEVIGWKSGGRYDDGDTGAYPYYWRVFFLLQRVADTSA